MCEVKGKLNSWELFIKPEWKEVDNCLAKEDNSTDLKNCSLLNSFVGF